MHTDLAALMFPVLFGLVFLGVPVGFALFACASVFGYILFGDRVAIQLFSRIADGSTNFVLAAIPLFVMMGAVLERSRLAARLFVVLRMWLAGVPGNLSIVTIVMCAVFAAASGVVGAVEVLVGMMAIPAMMRARYPKDVVAGSICAGGSLGTLIPPSVLLVVYASVADVSVGRLFAGIIGPAALTVGLFVVYLLLRGVAGPRIAQQEDIETPPSLAAKLLLTAQAFLPPAVLITAVLGSVLAGVASPTEAGAVGVAAAIALAATSSAFGWTQLKESLVEAVSISASILFIVLSGILFASVFVALGGNALIRGQLQALDLGPAGLVVLFLALAFLLGFVLDWIAVVLVLTPICAPIIREAGVDPIWFGILFCLALQTSYLTPPMAPSIFYLRSIAPAELGYWDMYKGVTPFILLQLIVIAAVYFLPGLTGR